jgi:esterase/lipase
MPGCYRVAKLLTFTGACNTGAIVLRKLVFLLTLCLAFSASARSETIGVVMMHGKTSTPAQFDALADQVSAAGFPVERPEMCWSRARIYDRTYLDCLLDADKAATALKAHGADAIVILGMSLGGNGALGFGARRPGLKGVIALAPASDPDRLRQRPPIAQSLAKAQALIAAGKGDDRTTFNDLNNGREFTVATTPKIYVSFFGKDTPGDMAENAAHLIAPLLIVSGTADATQRDIGAVFARAPRDPRNAHVIVNSDHIGTPDASVAAVLAFLKSLSR